MYAQNLLFILCSDLMFSGFRSSIIQEVEGTQVPMYLDSKEFSTPWSSDMTINVRYPSSSVYLGRCSDYG